MHAKVVDGMIYHYMDDVLVCAPDNDVLAGELEDTITALLAARLELQKEKVQKLLP